MKEDFFNVGYSSYLKEIEKNKTKWTSYIIEKILKHKIISTTIVIALVFTIINFWLIFKFMSVIETSSLIH